MREILRTVHLLIQLAVTEDLLLQKYWEEVQIHLKVQRLLQLAQAEVQRSLLEVQREQAEATISQLQLLVQIEVAAQTLLQEVVVAAAAQTVVTHQVLAQAARIAAALVQAEVQTVLLVVQQEVQVVLQEAQAVLLRREVAEDEVTNFFL